MLPATMAVVPSSPKRVACICLEKIQLTVIKGVVRSSRFTGLQIRVHIQISQCKHVVGTQKNLGGTVAQW